MTNGEKIKATFPHYDIEIDEHKGYVRVFYEDFYTTYPLRWWNAEYKEPTKNDFGVDCISREDAIRVASGYCHPSNVAKELAKLPSVMPQEPKTGHWVSHREFCEMNNLRPSGLGSYFWCSECDCGIDVMEWHRNNYNFCPNCGADMREVEE